MPDFAVILPAAGRSARFGGPVSKLFQMLDGKPVLSWTLAAFAQRDDVRQIVVASTDPQAIGDCAQFLDANERKKLHICGGARAGRTAFGLLRLLRIHRSNGSRFTTRLGRWFLRN